MFKSAISTVVELIAVNVPLTVKLPPTTTLPVVVKLDTVVAPAFNVPVIVALPPTEISPLKLAEVKACEPVSAIVTLLLLTVVAIM